MFAIGDAVVDELKPLFGPLIASELARQRAGGDPNAPSALPDLVRAPDRYRLRTCVTWSATRRLNLLTDITASIAGALADRINSLVRDTIIAGKIADGSAQREFADFVRETKAIPEAHRAARARIARLADVNQCLEVARARTALQGLVTSMRAKRQRRGRAA